MIRKIRESLFAKVFVITAVLLLCMSFLVFGILSWLTPKNYSGRLGNALDEQAKRFIAELEQVALQNSGGLFDQFAQNPQIVRIEFYAPDGTALALPSARADAAKSEYTEISAVSGEAFSESSPLLSGSYYFSFAGSDIRYMLIVYGSGEQIAQLQQSFACVFPALLAISIFAALLISLLYSHLITKPVLKISRISEKMSNLELEWQLDENHSDELGRLEKSLNILARKLAATISELQNANRKLEQDIEKEKASEQAQLDFFSAVSHELKTPVTIMKGQLEGMLFNIGVYKDREKYLMRSLEIANTLEGMIQEILTLSRLEAADANFRTEVFDCVPLIYDYLAGMEDLIVQKELRILFHPAAPAYVNGNKLLMEKVFSNLIGNAIKYSPQGADIWIEAENVQGEDIRVEAENVQRKGTWMEAENEQGKGTRTEAKNEQGKSIQMEAENVHGKGTRIQAENIQGKNTQTKTESIQRQFYFSVENSGAHIPEECIPKLFDAFYRVEQSRNRKSGGSGLGLYLVQKILLQYKSKCTVCNTDCGVRFSFFTQTTN